MLLGGIDHGLYKLSLHIATNFGKNSQGGLFEFT